MPIKGRKTQSIVNAYPLESSIRQDEQSVGFQLLNATGLHMDDLAKQQEAIHANYYLHTSVISDIDVFYSMQLPRNYEFTLEDDDILNLPTYLTPLVSGEVGTAQYEVTLASGNDIEGWWYKTVPDRITLGAVASGEHLLASGQLALAPLSILTTSGELHLVNQLWVTCSGGTSYLGVSDDNYLRRGIVQLDGTTRAGLDLVEEILFIHDDTTAAINDFQTLDQVRAYGMVPNTTFIKVESARFNHPFYQDTYPIDDNKFGQQSPLFWSVEVGESAGQYALVASKYIVDDVELRLSGFVDKEPIVKQELLDVAGNNVSILDIAIEPHSDRIWAVDDTNIYCYDSFLPYTNMKDLAGKNYDADSVIEPSSYYALQGGTITLEYTWKRPVNSIARHRVTVTEPDGVTYSIEDGAKVTHHTDISSWTFGLPMSRVIRASDDLVLSQRGQYVYTLEVGYADETTSIDKRIILVPSKLPLCQFDLSTIQVDNLRGVDIDSEYNIWVLTSTGGKHRVDQHFDQMIIDYDRKILYFREGYDRVRVLGV